MNELKDMSLEELWQLFPVILKEHKPDCRTWYADEKENLLHILLGHNVMCCVGHICLQVRPYECAQHFLSKLVEKVGIALSTGF